MTDTRPRPSESTHPNQLSHGKVEVLYSAGGDRAFGGSFTINRSPLAAGANYTLRLPEPDTYADKLAALHEYAHYILCVHGGRNYEPRGYGHDAHETLEEESLAWALVLRWVRAPLRTTRHIIGDPDRRLRAYVGQWGNVHSGRESLRVTLRWLQAAVKVVDTIYETGEWPGPKDRWIEAPE